LFPSFSFCTFFFWYLSIFPGLIQNIASKLPDPANADRLVEPFAAIDRQEQICNEFGQNLDLETIWASGEDMMDPEVTLLPSEENFQTPA
jgi:hypothetical protein